MEEDILAAAWEELAESGWAGFSLAAVAARAGTGNNSVYRRWPTKTALIRAATVRHSGTTRMPSRYSGDLVQDLLVVARASAAANEGPIGQALRGFVVERATRPADDDGPSTFDDSMPVRVVADIVEAAQADGRLPATPRTPKVINLGLTLIGNYFLLNGRSPTDDVLVEIVTDIWVPLLERE